MTTTPLLHRATVTWLTGDRPVVEIVIPIHNEAAVLERSVRRVSDFVAAHLPVPVRITIADNASTDASPLVAQLLSGHSELSVGTRLAVGSRVVRGPQRDFVSRTYHRLLRTTLRASFTDAQCGFEAIRTDVARAHPSQLIGSAR